MMTFELKGLLNNITMLHVDCQTISQPVQMAASSLTYSTSFGNTIRAKSKVSITAEALSTTFNRDANNNVAKENLNK